MEVYWVLLGLGALAAVGSMLAARAGRKADVLDKRREEQAKG